MQCFIDSSVAVNDISIDPSRLLGFYSVSGCSAAILKMRNALFSQHGIYKCSPLTLNHFFGFVLMSFASFYSRW